MEKYGCIERNAKHTCGLRNKGSALALGIFASDEVDLARKSIDQSWDVKHLMEKINRKQTWKQKRVKTLRELSGGMFNVGSSLPLVDDGNAIKELQLWMLAHGRLPKRPMSEVRRRIEDNSSVPGITLESPTRSLAGTKRPSKHGTVSQPNKR